MIKSITIHTTSRDEAHHREYIEKDIILNSTDISSLSDNGEHGFRIFLGYPPAMDGKEAYLEVSKVGENFIEIAHKKYNSPEGYLQSIKTISAGSIVSFQDQFFIYDMSAYYNVEVK